MPYTAASTVTAGDVYTSTAHNVIVNSLNSVGRAAFNVAQTSKTDIFSTTSTTFTDVTGLSVAITPSSATSKILVFVSIFCGPDVGAANFHGRLMRDSTAISIGDAAGSRDRVSFWVHESTQGGMVTVAYLDSPATVSSVTYKVQVRGSGAGTIVVNRIDGETDSVIYPRAASNIIVAEIPV